MGDMGDIFNEWRERKKQLRRDLGEDCIGCITHHPKRSPTILLPGQKCKVCGHRDTRPRTSPNGEAKP